MVDICISALKHLQYEKDHLFYRNSSVSESFISQIYISIYERDCLYLNLFHVRTAGPVSIKFCTDFHTNSGKILNTSMTPPTQSPGPQTPKPIQITGEKLCFTKNAWNFSWAALGPRRIVSHYIKKTICTYVPQDQPPPNFAQTSTKTRGKVSNLTVAPPT